MGNSDKTSVIIREVGTGLVMGTVICLIIFIANTNNPSSVYVSPLFDSLSAAIPYTLGLLFSVFFKNAPAKFCKKSFITTMIIVGILSILVPIFFYTVIFYTDSWAPLSIRYIIQFLIGLCIYLDKIVFRYFFNKK